MFYVPTNLYTTYKGQAGRLLSPNIWAHAKQCLLPPDGGDIGFIAGSDFKAFGKTLTVASNLGRYNDGMNQYLSYEDTGDAIAQIEVDTTRAGLVKFTSAATDNNESWLTLGDTKTVIGCISDTAGSAKKLGFEVRGTVGQLTETGLFWGLSEETRAVADNLVDDTGALADKDFIGFHCPMHASVAKVDFVYRKAGQTAQVLIDDLHTFVADEFVNLGFLYDPDAPASKQIKIFKNNVEQTTYVTAAQIAAATFPDGEELNLLLGQKVGAASAKTSTIDGWGFFQVG